MMTNNTDWEQVIVSFDILDRKLLDQNYDDESSKIFEEIKQYFINNKLHQWQLDIAINRMSNIRNSIALKKTELYQQKDNALKKLQAFDAYFATMKKV